MTAKKDQLQRFKDTARALGADESGEAFERAFKKIVPAKEAPAKADAKPRKRPATKPSRRAAS